MKEINLRDYYPFYTQDAIVEVPDEVAALLHELKLAEALLFCVHTGIKHTFHWITIPMWNVMHWWWF